jgi:hypothetical protein
MQGKAHQEVSEMMADLTVSINAVMNEQAEEEEEEGYVNVVRGRAP